MAIQPTGISFPNKLYKIYDIITTTATLLKMKDFQFNVATITIVDGEYTVHRQIRYGRVDNQYEASLLFGDGIATTLNIEEGYDAFEKAMDCIVSAIDKEMPQTYPSATIKYSYLGE